MCDQVPEDVSQLPAEILTLIFQRAIPPNILLQSALVCGPDSAWSRALELKKNILLVSWAWYDAGISFLYEDVVIRRLHQIFWLARTLSCDSGNALGGMVHSLDIQCYIPSGSALEAFGGSLELVLKCCPSLRRLSWSSPCRIPSSVIQYQSYIPASLCQLHLNAMIDIDGMQQLIFQSKDRLRYLRISPAMDADLDANLKANQPTVEIPHLETLHLQTERTRRGHEVQLLMNWNWNLPSLKSLIITEGPYLAYSTYTRQTNSTPRRIVDSEQGLISRYGKHLRYLSIEYRKPWDYLHNVLRCCPFLEGLTLSVQWAIPSSAIPVPAHPHLRYINLFLFFRHDKGVLQAGTTPSLGIRRFYALPDGTQDWLHHFGVTSASELDDSFDITMFQHHLRKRERCISWDVIPLPPRDERVEDGDGSELSDATGSEVEHPPQVSPDAEEVEERARRESEDLAFECDSDEDMDISDGSVSDLLDLLDEERPAYGLDAECNDFDLSLVGDGDG